MITRRGLIGSGAAVGLGACFPLAAARAAEADALFLTDLVEAENVLIALYQHGLQENLLDRRVAREHMTHERRHLANWLPIVRAAGSPIPDDAPAKTLERIAAVGSEDDFLGLAKALERDAIVIYIEGLKRLIDPELVRTAGRILASEAQHLTVLRGLAGEETLPEAFERGLT